QQPAQLLACAFVDAAMLAQAGARAVVQALEIPIRTRHADDRQIEALVPDHVLQRGEDLLVGEIAGGAEKHEGVGLHCHGLLLIYAIVHDREDQTAAIRGCTLQCFPSTMRTRWRAPSSLNGIVASASSALPSSSTRATPRQTPSGFPTSMS